MSTSKTFGYGEETDSKEYGRTKVIQIAGDSLEIKTQHILPSVNALLGSVNELMQKHFRNNLYLFSLCFATTKTELGPTKRANSILKKIIIFSKNQAIHQVILLLSSSQDPKTPVLRTNMLSGF